MIDNFGRKINYLRFSVTDRCDLRCRYCMPTKNANLFKEPYKKELGRLIIHGSLHLLGIEDKSTAQKKKMTILEEKFLEDESWRGLIEKS